MKGSHKKKLFFKWVAERKSLRSHEQGY